MSEEKLSSVKLVLGSTTKKLVRLSHVHAHVARPNKFSKANEFSVAALIPKGNTEDVVAVKAAIAGFIKEVWTDKKKPMPPQFWNPLRDGDKDTKQDGSPLGAECKGHYVLNCKTGESSPPDVVGTTKGGDGKLVKLGKADIKSGDWGRIGINLKPYTLGTSGIGVYLSTLQKVQAGDPLGNSNSAEDDFSEFDDDSTEAADFG